MENFIFCAVLFDILRLLEEMWFTIVFFISSCFKIFFLKLKKHINESDLVILLPQKAPS